VLSQNTIIILGPTAAGKTDAAIALAKRCNGSVISADSRQVYAGMNIGTAKPAAAWRAESHRTEVADDIDGVPHFLLNVRLPSQQYDLAAWQADAKNILASEHSLGRQAIVCGGTMLFLESLLYDYQLPHVPPNHTLRSQLAQEETAILYEQLSQRDPEATRFIQPHHKQRIIRALEVIQATGAPFSRLRQRSDQTHHFTVLGIFPGWSALQESIARRAVWFFEQGLIAETERLQKKFGADIPLLTTMGYREAAAVLAGQINIQQARTSLTQANLRYAHRQMNWWKRYDFVQWFTSSDELLAKFFLQ
jgi:tRNA dimethylallyltransferase